MTRFHAIQASLLGAFCCFHLIVSAAPATNSSKVIPPRLETNSFVVITNFYDIAGTNIESLRASRMATQPRELDPNFPGNTKWSITWNYQVAFQDGKCRVDAFRVRTRVTITLPRWAPPASADRELVRQWGNFSRSLMWHEQGHLTHVRQARAELLHRVAQLKTFDSPRELRAAVEATCNKVLTELRQRDDAYDRASNHGAGSGVKPVW